MKLGSHLQQSGGVAPVGAGLVGFRRGVGVLIRGGVANVYDGDYRTLNDLLDRADNPLTLFEALPLNVLQLAKVGSAICQRIPTSLSR